MEPSNRKTTRTRIRLSVAGLCLVAVLANPGAAGARYQHTGFSLDVLTAAAGTGPDPGPANPAARLNWAVETAVPREWRESVRVVWTVGPVSGGHLALSYQDGRTVLSSRVMSRSAEEVLATVAHEMGHQIAFAVVSPILGYPPQQFIDLSRTHSDARERWADCVARVWTGSLVHTPSEPGPCPGNLADFVAGQLADPSVLGATTKIVPPPVAVAAPPAPPVHAAPAPPAAPVPSPSSLFPSPGPRPRAGASPGAPDSGGPDRLGTALVLVPLSVALCAAGWWYVRSRTASMAAWRGRPDRRRARGR